MFTEPTDAQKQTAVAHLPRALPHLAGLYAEALKDLYDVIDHGTADPDRTLAAIASWREKERKKTIRTIERQLAYVLIGAGEPGAAVCRGLGISRTRLQQEMRADTEFGPLVPKGEPPIRKPAEEVRDAVA